MRGHHWRILAVLFVVRTTLGFQFQTISSVAPLLREQFGLRAGELGTLIGLYMLPGIILALPGGLLVRRFGDRSLCSVGLGLMVLGGLIVGLSDAFLVAFLGRLVSGSGAVLMSLALTKMATDWFAGSAIVTAMSILLTTWPLGIALALVIQPSLGEWLGWSWVMYGAAALCGLAGVLIAVFYRPPLVSTPLSTPPDSPASAAFVFPTQEEVIPVMLAGLIWGLFNLGLIMFFSFVPPLLVEHGLARPSAAFLTSLALWIMIGSLPAGGYIVQRSGRPNAAVTLFSGLSGVALIGLATFPGVALLMCIALGICVGPPAGAIMAMPSRVLQPGSRAVGLGLFMLIYYVATAVGPSIAGFLQDHVGTVAPVLLGAAVFMSIIPLVVLFQLQRR